MKTRIMILAIFSLLLMQAQAQHYNRPHNRHTHPGYYNIRPMHPADFDQLYAAVANHSSDSRKIRTAGLAIENNLMTAEQISALVSLMTFERNKVDLAKTGWLYVYDPGNFFRVLNMFTFNSSVREMHAYMAANPRQMPVHNASPIYSLHPVTMHPVHFREAKFTVASQNFEESKLHIARQIAASNSLTSQQVYELMTLFSFESTRLEFAIFAYRYVYDPGNYFLTHRAFRYSSSVERLNAAILRG